MSKKEKKEPDILDVYDGQDSWEGMTAEQEEAELRDVAEFAARQDRALDESRSLLDRFGVEGLVRGAVIELLTGGGDKADQYIEPLVGEIGSEHEAALKMLRYLQEDAEGDEVRRLEAEIAAVEEQRDNGEPIDIKEIIASL